MQSIQGRVIYVAAPYTSDDPQTVEARVREAAAYGAYLFAQGALPYVPTAHGHALWEAGQREGRPIGHDYKPWQRHARRFLRFADELHVLLSTGGSAASGSWTSVTWRPSSARRSTSFGRTWAASISPLPWRI